jgi:hypothetical protein
MKCNQQCVFLLKWNKQVQLEVSVTMRQPGAAVGGGM